MRLNIERQNKLEPARIESTKQALEDMGYAVIERGKSLIFVFAGRTVTLWPYSGWFSGKSVKPGRGFDNLLKQIIPKP